MNNDDLVTELVTLRKEYGRLADDIYQMDSHLSKVRDRLRLVMDEIGFEHDYLEVVKQFEDRLLELENRLFVETLRKPKPLTEEGGAK